jgi:tetratricopeptide (TPR) repeat protein
MCRPSPPGRIIVPISHRGLAMNYRFPCCAFLTLTLTLFASAQGSKSPGGGTTSTPSTTPRTPGPMQPPMNAPDSTMGRRAFITGRVVLDDGTPLTEGATIQTICQGHKQTVAHTDSHGGFSFELGDRMGAAVAGISAADVDSSYGPSYGPSTASRGIQREWRSCELQADLPGFTSQAFDLSSRMSTFESADIGRLVMHRMGQVEGLTISVTSALAPRDAQKAFEKGREKENKEKWDEAQPLFEKAVQIYPKYAVAWFELGHVQLRKKENAQARNSFEQSIAADPKYVNPYRGLADLNTQEAQWPAVVDVTERLLALNPVNFPDAWFRNAIGNYYLHNFAVAEKSARQGMKVDENHQFPKLEYLLGVILMQKHEYKEATTHIQNYLRVATQPAEIEEAQKRLAEITKVSASVSDPNSDDKK